MLRAVVTPSQFGHSVLPADSYVVVCLAVIEHLTFHGVVAILIATKARCGNGFASDAGMFLWWWAAPTIAVVMVSIGVAMLRHHAAISVAFVYAVS